MPSALNNLMDSIRRVREIAVDIDAHVVDALTTPAVKARHDTTLCAATVILSGFLESFLRETAEEIITDICNRSIPFGTLPAEVRITHFRHGANHVEKIAQREKSEQPMTLGRATDAARRLASVGDPCQPYEIIWEAFAETQANPGPNAIRDFLSRFDIDKPLPTLACAMGISDATLFISLQSFMAVRNSCAHTGSADTVPTTTDVTAYCKLVESVAAGIAKVFQDILAKAPYV